MAGRSADTAHNTDIVTCASLRAKCRLAIRGCLLSLLQRTEPWPVGIRSDMINRQRSMHMLNTPVQMAPAPGPCTQSPRPIRHQRSTRAARQQQTNSCTSNRRSETTAPTASYPAVGRQRQTHAWCMRAGGNTSSACVGNIRARKGVRCTRTLQVLRCSIRPTREATKAEACCMGEAAIN